VHEWFSRGEGPLQDAFGARWQGIARPRGGIRWAGPGTAKARLILKETAFYRLGKNAPGRIVKKRKKICQQGPVSRTGIMAIDADDFRLGRWPPSVN